MERKNCPYAVLNIKGLTQWMTCNKNNNEYCAFQRYCQDVKRVISSEGAVACPLRQKEE